MNFEKLKKKIYSSNGKLITGTEEELKDTRVRKPFQNIDIAFKKLRNDVPLNDEELDPLKNFVEEFTTVSLHINTVGKDVARIAKEVNVHHHTRTCRKYNNQCRFNYPRFPSHETIISKPFNGSKDERDKLFKNFDRNLNKVFAILCDDEKIDAIMKNYKKDEETKESHTEFIKKRIVEILDLAEVSFEDYFQALSF